jgi:hypothetical protein
MDGMTCVTAVIPYLSELPSTFGKAVVALQRKAPEKSGV